MISFMIRKATDRIRISKEGKAKIEDDIRRTGKTSAQLLDHYLSIDSDIPTSVPKPVASPVTIRRETINQPPQGLIDAFIMDVFGVTKLRLITDLRIDQIPIGLKPFEWDAEVRKRTLAFTAELANLPDSLSRKNIINKASKSLSDKGWKTIYSDWFESSKDNHGDFQTLMDKRLASLVAHSYLTRARAGGYSFIQNNLFHRDLDLIAGIINLIPQNGLKITKLLQRNLFQVDTYRDYENRH